MKVTFNYKGQVLCTCDIKILPELYTGEFRRTTSITIDGRDYSLKDTFHEIKIDTFTQKCIETFTVFLE